MNERDARRLFADVSDYQKKFDAHAYAKAGHLLVGLKAGQGTGHGGASLYSHRVGDAHAHRLAVAHYWYCEPQHPAAEQVRLLWDTVKPHWREGDYLVLDVETEPSSARWWLSVADPLLTKYSGHEAIGYSYRSFITTQKLRVKSGRWWFADYSGRPSPLSGLPLGFGRRRWAHQYTDGKYGPLPHVFAGIGACDGSCLNMRTVRRLEKLRGARKVN